MQKCKYNINPKNNIVRCHHTYHKHEKKKRENFKNIKIRKFTYRTTYCREIAIQNIVTGCPKESCSRADHELLANIGSNGRQVNRRTLDKIQGYAGGIQFGIPWFWYTMVYQWFCKDPLVFHRPVVKLVIKRTNKRSQNVLK